MTIYQLYDAALIECNKVKAPALLVQDYVYFLNKAVQQYVNQVYNRCEYNQQSSDDLAFLQTTAHLDAIPDITGNSKFVLYYLDGTSDDTKLAGGYLHVLNCIGEFTLTGSSADSKCPNKNTASTIINVNCQRLTADLQGGILDNYYMKPSIKKPYFYISRQTVDTKDGVYLEIYAGGATCDKIHLTYLRTPDFLQLNEEDILTGNDTSNHVEFPDYVCYEIINIFTRLILEHASDPRLQTNIPINQTIGLQTK